MKITDWRIRKLIEEVPREERRDLFSFVPRQRMTGMDSTQLIEVLDAFGRPDLAIRALTAMEIPITTWEPTEPGMLRVMVSDESHTLLYEVEAPDRYTRDGDLPAEAAKELFCDLAGTQ